MKFLRQPRLRLAPGKTRIGHLLVVSGPSASGKSSFLKQLGTGGLPPDIVAALPPGASDWPQTNGRRIVGGGGSRGRPRLAREPDGLVLHYDFLRPFETSIAGYADDQALAALAAADAITIVTLHAAPERLAEALAARPPKVRRLDPLRKTAASLGIRAPGKPAPVYDKATEHARHARLIALYRQPGWLAEWHERWRRFVDGSRGGRPGGDVHVEWTAEADGPSFRLL